MCVITKQYLPNRSCRRQIASIMAQGFPVVFFAVDGIAGKKTSDAFKLLTSHYLLGDPRP